MRKILKFVLHLVSLIVLLAIVYFAYVFVQEDFNFEHTIDSVEYRVKGLFGANDIDDSLENLGRRIVSSDIVQDAEKALDDAAQRLSDAFDD